MEAREPTTFVYVDGFNLYYRKLQGTPHKWLNLRRFAELMLPKNDVREIYYFTARITPRPGDPEQPQRQQTYLRALGSIGAQIVFGTFQSKPKQRPLLNDLVLGDERLTAGTAVWILDTEEKGSDVNLATLLLGNAAARRCDMSVVVSNDSDLELAIRTCCQDLRHPVGVLSTQPSNSLALKSGATFYKRIRQGVLRESQFADVLSDADGEFHKPPTW